jgi:hypothetical protein
MNKTLILLQNTDFTLVMLITPSNQKLLELINNPLPTTLQPPDTNVLPSIDESHFAIKDSNPCSSPSFSSIKKGETQTSFAGACELTVMQLTAPLGNDHRSLQNENTLASTW